MGCNSGVDSEGWFLPGVADYKGSNNVDETYVVQYSNDAGYGARWKYGQYLIATLIHPYTVLDDYSYYRTSPIGLWTSGYTWPSMGPAYDFSYENGVASRKFTTNSIPAFDRKNNSIKTISGTSILGNDIYPPPLNITLSGPTTLNYNQPGTFTANVTGGSAPYTYKWWYRNDAVGGPIDEANLVNTSTTTSKKGDGSSADAAPVGYWLELLCYNSGGGAPIPCTNQRQFSYQTNFSLKCEVTDSNGGVATTTYSVSILNNSYFAKINEDNPLETDGEKNTEFNIPIDYSMESFPNPFNPSTNIRFGLPTTENVKVSVYNITGQLLDILHNGELRAGFHNFPWDGSRFASGVYLVVINSSHHVSKQKIILAK